MPSYGESFVFTLSLEDIFVLITSYETHQFHSSALTEDHLSVLRLEKGVQAHPVGCSDIEGQMEAIGGPARMEALEAEVAMVS